MAESPFRFTVAQLLMVTPLVAILAIFPQTGGCGRPFEKVSHLDFSPDGEHLAVEYHNARDAQTRMKLYLADLCRTIEILDPETGKRRVRVEQDFRRGNQGPASEFWCGAPSMRFTSEGNALLVTEHGGGAIRSWDIESASWGPSLVAPVSGYGDWALSSDGRVLATTESTEVTLWEVGSGTTRASFAAYCRMNSDTPTLVFSPDDSVLSIVGTRNLELRDVKTGNLIRQIPDPGSVASSKDVYGPYAVAFSPDGATLALAWSDGVRLYDMESGTTRTLISDYPEEVEPDATPARRSRRIRYTFSIAFSPDGERLAAVGDYGVELVDASTGQRLWTHNREGRTHCVAFSPDGGAVATGGDNGKVTVWDAATGRKLWATRIRGRWRTPLWVPFALLALWVVAWRAVSRRIRRHDPAAADRPAESRPEPSRPASA